MASRGKGRLRLGLTPKHRIALEVRRIADRRVWARAHTQMPLKGRKRALADMREDNARRRAINVLRRAAEAATSG